MQYFGCRQLVGDVALKKKDILKQMMRSFIAAERCDLEPKLASLWWSSTYSGEIQEDMTMEAQRGRHKFPFGKSQDSGILSNQSGTWHDSPEGRVQKAQRAWNRDVRFYRSMDVLWR